MRHFGTCLRALSKSLANWTFDFGKSKPLNSICFNRFDSSEYFAGVPAGQSSLCNSPTKTGMIRDAHAVFSSLEGREAEMASRIFCLVAVRGSLPSLSWKTNRGSAANDRPNCVGVRP